MLRRFVRNSKYETMVDEVELLYANSAYAHIRLPSGRESTVTVSGKHCIWDLAPVERSESVIHSGPRMDETSSQQSQLKVNDSVLLSNEQLDISRKVITPNDQTLPRRSMREKR